jgi:hypothetical protein
MTTTDPVTVIPAAPSVTVSPEKPYRARIANYVTQRLTGLDMVNSAFIRGEATVGEDDFITLDLTEYDFNGPDRTARVLIQLLHPTAPADTTPEPAPGPGEAA